MVTPVQNKNKNHTISNDIVEDNPGSVLKKL